MDDSKLKYTGERMQNHKESDIYKLHMGRYDFALQYAKGKNTLDIACGTGYGTEFLGSVASRVVGADIDEVTIKYCRSKYQGEKITFKTIHPNILHDEFVGVFDLVVSFETIEHADKPMDFLDNLLKYVKEGGIVVLSTPNNYLKVYPPRNRFHSYEFDIIELLQKLEENEKIERVDLFGQYKTNIERNSKVEDSLFRKIIKYIFATVYDLDLKYLGLLKLLEHTSIYKKVGNLQRNYEKDFGIYKIDRNSNFVNPTCSIYVIHVKHQRQ